MIGQTISHYRVTGRLGAGGMGVVYEAEDIRLGRKVAIKMLHDTEKRLEVMERFRREARTASSLNHPNICTIYEIEEEAGHQFIVMELLEGETLTQRIGRKALTPELVIEYGIQIAEALDAAHRKGIIHRDIKPANLFLNDRDQIKVLDFGLAKLDDLTASLEVAASTSDGSSSVVPTSAQMTREGRTMGTLHYMSPEQARGEELDSRSDVFSCGMVLYEMATGSPPFKGGTAAIVFSEILNKNPLPPSQTNPALPVKLDEIILKALEKEKDYRYQSAAELRADLKRLKRDSESSQSAASAGFAAVRSAKPLKKLRVWRTTAAVVAIALAGALLWWKPWHRPEAAAAAQWQQLTDFADSVAQPALSPDGHMLAFIRGGGDTFLSRGQLYVKVLPNGEAKQLTHDSMLKFAPIFSPDGSQIIYTAVDSKFGWSSFMVPVLGGEPRLMLPNASGLNYSKDGQLIFSEMKGTGANMAIVTSGESRMNERDIYVPPTQRGMAHRSALSPDGKWVVLVEMDNDGWEPCRVVPFDGSNAGRRVGPTVSHCTSATWSPDGRTIYFSADAGTGFHIWRQDFPDGESQQITFGPTEQEGIVYDASTNSLITAAGGNESTLWLHSPNAEKQISSEGYADWPQLSPDGRQVYYMVLKYKVGAMGFISGELFAADLDTGEITAVIPGTEISSFSISPEGTQVVYAAYDGSHHPHVWVASLDRSAPPRQLFAEEADQPLFAPGGIVYYRAHAKDINVLMRYRPSGSREQVFSSVHELFGISPSGKWIRAWAQDPSDPKRSPYLLIDTSNGRWIQVCEGCEFTWGANGRVFQFFVSSGGKSITYAIPLKTGEELPPIPAGGFQDVERQLGAEALRFPGNAVKSPRPDTWIESRRSTHRNIYRIPLQ